MNEQLLSSGWTALDQNSFLRLTDGLALQLASHKAPDSAPDLAGDSKLDLSADLPSDAPADSPDPNKGFVISIVGAAIAADAQQNTLLLIPCS